jgi:hypothetical protein
MMLSNISPIVSALVSLSWFPLLAIAQVGRGGLICVWIVGAIENDDKLFKKQSFICLFLCYGVSDS